MRSFRSSLFAAIVGTAAVGSTQLVACGGGDDKPVQAEEAEQDSGTSAPETTISETRTKIYFGQTAKLDGAAIAPSAVTDIAWELIFAPGDSKLTTANLADANTATPRFTPDVFGGYTLRVTGKKDGQTSSVFVYVEAIDAPVFWRAVGYKRNSVSATVRASTFVAGVYSAPAKEIACATEEHPDRDSVSVQVATFFGRAGGSAGDVWEAPAGKASLVAYAEVDLSEVAAPGGEGPPTGEVKSRLVVATSDNACAAGDAKVLDTSNFPYDSGQGLFTDAVQNVRFSPDGSRIAYLRGSRGRTRVASIGIDGSGKRELSPFQSRGTAAGGLDPEASVPGIGEESVVFQRQPRWKDQNHVTWVTFVGPTAQTTQSEWELYSVEDRDGASAELQMRCSAFGISSYDFLPDGTILAAVNTLQLDADAGDGDDDGDDDGPGGVTGGNVMNIAVIRPNAATKECEIVRALTQNTATWSVARDLALSPDKSKVAYFGGTGSGIGVPGDPQNLSLNVLAVDGSGGGVVKGVRVGTADPGIGPRWAAGGAALTWGKTNGVTGLNSVGTVASIPAAGGVEREVATGAYTVSEDGEVTEVIMISGIGQGCGVSRGTVPSGVFAAGAGLGLAALVARRRRVADARK